MKICNKCKILKDFSEFHKGSTKDGYQYRCKLCKKKYAEENKDLENLRKTKWRLENPNKVKISKNKYYQNNKIKERTRNSKYHINKRKEDPIFRLSCNIRTRIYYFLKGRNIKKTNKTYDLIGCSPILLKEHIENQFTEGMSWDLVGERIHIDHIIPLSSAKNEEELFKLFHYTNLQPLWAKDNLKKGKKINVFLN